MSSLSRFFNLVLILNDWTFGLYAALAIQMIVSVVMDVFLLSQLDVSLKRNYFLQTFKYVVPILYNHFGTLNYLQVIKKALMQIYNTQRVPPNYLQVYKYVVIILYNHLGTLNYLEV